jgi:hypothetical protein
MSTPTPNVLPQPAPMVGWFDPLQLIRTGSEVLISTIFGRYADERLIQALSSGTAVIYDFTKRDVALLPLGAEEAPRAKALAAQLNLPAKVDETQRTGDFWFDYVADVGDGWDSTYAVAYAMRRDGTLRVTDPTGAAHEPHRGEILVFGGDEVYPVASGVAYEKRLAAPYRAAFGAGPYPTVFAVPGNHDWYDNLMSFSRLFGSNQPFAGPEAEPGDPAKGCPTLQRRSYFALKLPHGWWLLGTDVQLGSDIDGPQYDFFDQVRKQMAPDDRIILCTPEPHWVYAVALPPQKTESSKRALDSLERVLEGRVRVFISGDVHHYCCYESDAPACPGTSPESERKTHKITAGGGGAFLHPTHGQLNVRTLDGGFTKQTCAPTPAKSWWLGCRNLLFPACNPWFGLVTAVCYTLILLFLVPAIDNGPSFYVVSLDGYFGGTVPGLYAEANPLRVLWYLFGDAKIGTFAVLHRTILVVLGLAIWVAFMLFTDLGNWAMRALSGFLHGAAHYLAAILLAWGAGRIAFLCWGAPPIDSDLTFWQPRHFAFASAFVFVTGWLVGSLIMGAYLFVSLNFFRHQWNAAFSALKIKDWKNFLRLKIGADGALTIYPIGIPRVPRAWKPAPAGAPGPTVVPDGEELGARLIEKPIVVWK